MDNTKTAGFSVVELLVTISVYGILSTAFFGAMINYYAVISRNNLAISMTVDSQNLLRSTVEELRYGAGVRQSNSIADPYEPAGGWDTDNASFVIVIASPARDNNRDFILDPETGYPYNNELVYYRSGNTLYRRTLAHPLATGNRTLTSCPAANATASCPADAKLIEFAKDMNFFLYNQDNTLTNDPLAARSIGITLTLERDTIGKPLVLENSIRMTLRNNF